MYLAGESWSLELYSSHQGPSPVAVSFKHQEQLDTDIEYILICLLNQGLIFILLALLLPIEI